MHAFKKLRFPWIALSITLSMNLWMALMISSPAALAASIAPPKTVDHVEITRYLGPWYEIARLPNRFERDCARDATAHYSLDGKTIRVVNRCLKADGKAQVARGRAKIVDHSTNAKLKVTFFWPFYGDYWILGLGSPANPQAAAASQANPVYPWAVVGGPRRKYLWILARRPTLTPLQREEVRRVVEESGYEWSKLLWTAQSGS